MKSWMKSSWFVNLVSCIKEAISDALVEIEKPGLREKVNAVLRYESFHSQPHMLSDRMVVTELGKAMTRDRLQGQDLSVYDWLYFLLPSMRKVRESLLTDSLHENVKIPPTPPVITDGRIPVEDFWDAINKQVFIIRVD